MLIITPINENSSCPVGTLEQMVNTIITRTLWERGGDGDVTIYSAQGSAREVIDYLIFTYELTEDDGETPLTYDKDGNPSDIFNQIVEMLNTEDAFEIAFI